MPRRDEAQLREEEQIELAQIARGVPEGGVIVEIGTGQGGSAAIFHRATHQRNIGIYSADIAPSRRARRNLQGTNVQIFESSSSSLGALWMQQVRKPVDLLFIDGGHSFQNVYEDFTLWVGNLRPGALVVFHDYDPAERGGLAHFGVRVCIDTIRRIKLLDLPQHTGRLFYGRIAQPDEVNLPVMACLRTLLGITDEVVQIRESILRQPMDTAFCMLRDRTFPLDSVQACYCMDALLKVDYDFLDEHSYSRPEFRKRAETLFMLEHGFGLLPLEERIKEIPGEMESNQLSRFIAAEQTRLTILADILRTLVPWTP